MPGHRHVRLLALAVLVALAVALVPRPADPPIDAPGGAQEAAAARGGPRVTRIEPYVPQPDPDGGRGELAVVRPASPLALRGYVWPLPLGRLTLPFEHSAWGSRIVDGERFHDGLDLATFCGDRIVAAHDGVVLAAGRRYDRFMGWQGDLQPYFARLDEKKAWTTLPIVVVIDDGNGYRSVYAHFRKTVVEVGQRVRAGELIGYEGATGRASGCHLHYGLFSPQETATFEIAPDVVKALLVPRYQTARIDPRLVLPELREPEPIGPPTKRPDANVPAAPVEYDGE